MRPARCSAGIFRTGQIRADPGREPAPLSGRLNCRCLWGGPAYGRASVHDVQQAARAPARADLVRGPGPLWRHPIGDCLWLDYPIDKGKSQ